MRNIVFLSTLLISSLSYAIDAPKTVYAEIGVNGVAQTINTEFNVTKNTMFRVGLGVDPDSSTLITMPIGLNYLLGQDNHKFEMGMSLQPHSKKYSDAIWNGNDYDYVTKESIGIRVMPSLGYRYISDNGYIFRSTFNISRRAFSTNNNDSIKLLTPFNAISFGYMF